MGATSGSGTPPTGRRSTVRRMPGPGRTVFPSSPVPAPRSPAPSASPSPAATPPPSRSRSSRRTRAARRVRRGDRRRHRHLRRGQGAQAASARQRGDGLHDAVRRRRRPPPHPRDDPEPQRRRGGAGHRLLHADARAHVPRHPRHVQREGEARDDRRERTGGVREGVRRRAVRAPPPRGAVARDRLRVRLQRRSDPGRVRRGRRPRHRDQRHRQPCQGHRRRRGAEHEHRPRAPRGHRSFHDRSAP